MFNFPHPHETEKKKKKTQSTTKRTNNRNQHFDLPALIVKIQRINFEILKERKRHVSLRDELLK